MNLLEKVRKFNETLQKEDEIDIRKLALLMSDLENANVYCCNAKGEVLGYYQMVQCPDETRLVEVDGVSSFPDLYTRFLSNMYKTEVIPNRDETAEMQNTIVTPVYQGQKRLGSLVMDVQRKEVKNDDLVLSEFAGTVLGVAIARINSAAAEQMKMVAVALETLSFSETVAVKAILENIEGLEGYVVASKIADSRKLTRSVIVNALRKLESAGVIETRSLGMKGTFIRVRIPGLLKELK